jgi:hypothetical protein
MKYLRGLTFEFENAIARGMLSYRSAELNATVKAVNNHVQSPTADNLREVRYRYGAWKDGQPAEFQQRGRTFEDAFWQELNAEYRSKGIQLEPDFESDGEVGHRRRAPLELPPPPGVAVNRWTNPRFVKRGAKIGMGAASAGISVAQNFTVGASTQALILGGAAAVSATGVGLIVTAIGLTIATSVLNATAAWKTSGHIDQLNDVYQHRNASPFNDEQYCQQIPSGNAEAEVKTRASYMQHDMIANHVLPYIIRKKKAKYARKVVGAIPLLGSVETVRALGKKAYKAASGTMGKNRTNAAGWLACHLITCDCILAQVIVSELYSREEMEWLKGQPYEDLTGYLASKFKST